MRTREVSSAEERAHISIGGGHESVCPRISDPGQKFFIVIFGWMTSKKDNSPGGNYLIHSPASLPTAGVVQTAYLHVFVRIFLFPLLKIRITCPILDRIT